MPHTMMRAAVHTNYGPPEVTQIQDVPKPQPEENEVLVKVYSSTVNRTDSGLRSAEYFISRFFTGLFAPKYQILGSEFAGIIEQIGPGVTNFKVGDRVFGFNEKTFGGHAEYLTVSENDAIATLPEGFGYDEAAALTEGSHYALVDIRAAKVQRGQQVLVYGATGAIGSAAVQLLKHFGAQVTAVCATKYIPLVKSLGADTVIDYQTEDFTKSTIQFDFIFDAVGKSSFQQCKPLLTPQGIYISTELGKNGVNILLALTTRFSRGKKLLFPIPSISKEEVLLLKALAESGAFKPVIDRHFHLNQIVEAYHYVESGQKIGNVILKIVEDAI